MPEKPGSQQPDKLASSSYMKLQTVKLDNTALAQGALGSLYTDLQAQILGTASALSPDIQQIAFKPENLRPQDLEQMHQVIQLVFRQLGKGYEWIKGHRNPAFSLAKSQYTPALEKKKFQDFIPQARSQVLDVASNQGQAWSISPAGRSQLIQALNFVQDVLLASHRGHPILEELHRYPGAVARDLQAPIPDRVRLGISQAGDPKLFGLDEVLPDAFTRGSIAQQTGAPAPAEEKDRLGRNQPTPRPPLKTRPPKP